ncbi:hypothetical protein AB4027_06895 [Alkalibacterium putridalgicola]
MVCDNLQKHLEKKGLKIKEKKNQSFKTLTTKEKDDLFEEMARELGYID